jgi:hypothetical protein
MAVGLPAKTTYADGDVFSASDINDTNGTINLTAAPFAAGKNKIINGDYGIWQRSTSFTMSDGSPRYGAADRWLYGYNASTAGTNTISREAFPVGQTDVPNNPTYFQRWTVTALGTSQTRVDTWQNVENASTFASQTVTLSFYVKSSGTFGISTFLEQNFGSGGSATVTTTTGTGNTSTSWTRFTTTVTLPSISGKTVGASNYLRVLIRFNNPTTGATFDVSNVQLESGSTATAFQTATGTIQGELAACQRYYYRANSLSPYGSVTGYGAAYATNACEQPMILPVTMRTTSTTIDYSGIIVFDPTSSYANPSSIIGNSPSSNLVQIRVTFPTGVLTQFRATQIGGNNNAAAYLGISAEL